jgi:hypothetical protein
MDVFAVRDRLIDDYSEYVRSFIQIRDSGIRNEVVSALDSGLLWPEPLIQLDPAFQAGDSIDELVESGILHDECGRVFRKDKEQGFVAKFGSSC